MNLRIPRLGALGLAAFLAVAVVVFVWLMGRFGGPSISLSGAPYHAAAVVADAQGLATKSDVLVRGVKVGEVQSITVRGGRARVSFSIADRYAPISRAATVRVGQKTLLGESYVDLDPGPSTAVARLPDGATLPPAQVHDGVELDEALKGFDEPTQRHMRSLLDTFGTGAAAPETSDRVSGTIGRLDELTGQLRALAGALRGQASDVAGAVADGRTALEAIGAHERQISEVVSGAESTLGAMATQRTALGGGLDELARLLATAHGTLADVRPLIADADPLVADLNATAPRLTSALRALPPVARDARALLDRLPRLTAAALPTLDDARPVLTAAAPVARLLEPALANLVPILRYLEPRADTLAAWFANTAAIGSHGDAKGKWVRFSIFVEPGTASGTEGSFSNNAYTDPGDARANQPYEAGSYPRLRPYRP